MFAGQGSSSFVSSQRAGVGRQAEGGQGVDVKPVRAHSLRVVEVKSTGGVCVLLRVPVSF